MHIDYNVLLDATQDDCPIPVIKTKEMLDTMSAGEVLKVVTTREGTIRNIRTLVSNNDYKLLQQLEENARFHFYIEKL
ncbi:MAG: sulfurtransferase TusA family protein [Gammaproteobacteria bacterium]|nr:sulfurtransferase TusA family protein [Gammaproteobacteria bacterium]MBU1482713.1 sulfurtransferase TusA family protein [Gammaproteobacteria bacterium]